MPDLIIFSAPLLNSHTAVLFTPSVVGLFGDPDLSTGFTNGSALVKQDLSFTELVHYVVTIHEQSPSELERELWPPRIQRCTLEP